MRMDKRDRLSSGTVQFPFSVLTHVVAIYSLIFPFKHKETVNTGYSSQFTLTVQSLLLECSIIYWWLIEDLTTFLFKNEFSNVSYVMYIETHSLMTQMPIKTYFKPVYICLFCKLLH